MGRSNCDKTWKKKMKNKSAWRKKKCSEQKCNLDCNDCQMYTPHQKDFQRSSEQAQHSEEMDNEQLQSLIFKA